MDSKLFFIVLLVISSCSAPKKSTLDLLNCVPQNSVITFQLNDQNMLKNAINNLPFLSNILAIDTVIYKKIHRYPQTRNACGKTEQPQAGLGGTNM